MNRSTGLGAVPGHGARAALKWTLFKHASALNGAFSQTTTEKVSTMEKMGDKFRVGASTACEKVNILDTGENLFRLCARVLPLELVPVPGHGAQICARAPTKGYVQNGALQALFRPIGLELK